MPDHNEKVSAYHPWYLVPLGSEVLWMGGAGPKTSQGSASIIRSLRQPSLTPHHLPATCNFTTVASLSPPAPSLRTPPTSASQHLDLLPIRYLDELTSDATNHHHQPCHHGQQRRRRSLRPLCEARSRERRRQCAHTRPAARKFPTLDMATRSAIGALRSNCGGAKRRRSDEEEETRSEEKTTITTTIEKEGKADIHGGVIGNRQCSSHDAKQHSQDLRTWRAVGQSAGQDRPSLDPGQQLPPRSESSTQANVVEGHEDANVHHYRHHPLASHHYRAQW